MIDQVVIKKLKDRYKDIHPLIFQRSVEKARTAGELFDILDSFKHKYPMVWNDQTRRWGTTNDLIQKDKFQLG